MCLVMVLLAIIAAIAGLNLQSYTMNRNLKTAARDIASDIYLCRENAITNPDTSYTITFNQGSNNYVITGTDTTSGAIKVTQTKSPSAFQQGIVIDTGGINLDDGGTTITCQARGTLNPGGILNPGGAIRLKNSKGYMVKIKYTTTGRIYTCTPSDPCY